jgi:hypothetical protein
VSGVLSAGTACVIASVFVAAVLLLLLLLLLLQMSCRYGVE